jgi:hypothetical protein
VPAALRSEQQLWPCLRYLRQLTVISAISGIDRIPAQSARHPHWETGYLLSHLLDCRRGNLGPDLLESVLNSLRASPCQQSDDLSRRLLRKGKLPGRYMLQLHTLLAEVQPTAAARCPIDCPNGHLCRKAQGVCGRGSGGNDGFCKGKPPKPTWMADAVAVLTASWWLSQP